MAERAELVKFEQALLPHLGAAYNLARWLSGNDHDAEDVVQESYLRALKFFPGFRGGNSRTWLLTIVRNTCYTWLRQNRLGDLTVELDEEIHEIDSGIPNPEAVLLAASRRELLARALQELPVALREIVILRELEGLSYKEIADFTGVAIGTVMSRLARARGRLEELLAGASPTGARA